MAFILVVDDDEQIRMAISMILERAGHEVWAASDGNAGIESCRKRCPDIVLTDLIMPDKEGIETIIELRREFPQIKILAMSGGGYALPETYLKMASKLGAVHTFIKPIDRKELVTTIASLL